MPPSSSSLLPPALLHEIRAKAQSARAQGLVPAISYCRVSGIEQVKGMSLGSQEQTNQHTAEQLGAHIVHTIREQYSGAFYSSREGIQQALELIEGGVCSMLCVAFVDRSGRDVDVIRDIHRRVCQAGAQFATPRGVVGPEADAVAMLTMEALFAEWERSKIKDRTDMGKRKKAEAGICPTRIWAPMGFAIVRKSDVQLGIYPEHFEGRYVAAHPEALATVRTIFDMVLAGFALRAIVRHLIATGAQTVRGGQWHQSAISNLLHNPIYCGKPVWGSSKHSKDERRLLRGQSMRFHVSVPVESRIPLLPPLSPDGSEWEPLVTEAQWHQVQALLAHNKANSAGNPERVRLLSGLMRCPRCGDKLRGKNARENSPNYACGTKGCYFHLSAKVAHERLFQGLYWLFSTPEAWEAAAVRQKEKLAQVKPSLDQQAEVRRIGRQLRELDTEEAAVSQALVMALKAGGKATVLSEELGRIEARRGELLAVQARMESQTPGKGEREAVGDVAAILQGMRGNLALLEPGALPIPQQRALLSRFIGQIEVKREGKRGPVSMEMLLSFAVSPVRQSGSPHPFEHRNSFLCSISASGECSLSVMGPTESKDPG